MVKNFHRYLRIYYFLRVFIASTVSRDEIGSIVSDASTAVNTGKLSFSKNSCVLVSIRLDSESL